MSGNGLLSAEAVALRAEGRDAARSGKPVEVCPYPRGDWRLLEWRIGHIGFDCPVSPALQRQAYNARRRAARRREREVAALVRPETTGRLCKLATCRGSIPWNTRVGKARNEAREFCCPAHQHEHAAIVAAERRTAMAAVDPKGARRREREAERRRRVRQAPAVEASAAEMSPAQAPAPDVVTPLMWRLAAAGETEGGMRCAGLTPRQIARVLELQRRGSRVAA